MSSVVVQAMRFGAVGLVNTTVGLSAIYAFQIFFNAGPIIANMSGYAIGIVFSFILNRNWTFGQGNSGYQDLPKFLRHPAGCGSRARARTQRSRRVHARSRRSIFGYLK
jgi:putative flippase GtrA